MYGLRYKTAGECFPPTANRSQRPSVNSYWLLLFILCLFWRRLFETRGFVLSLWIFNSSLSSGKRSLLVIDGSRDYLSLLRHYVYWRELSVFGWAPCKAMFSGFVWFVWALPQLRLQEVRHRIRKLRIFKQSFNYQHIMQNPFTDGHLP